MKVKCYEEDNERIGAQYDIRPEAAARCYCNDWLDGNHGSVNVCVEPVDDEALALGGWHSDEDSQAFRMFVVTPRPSVEWDVSEVATFNPHAKVGA